MSQFSFCVNIWTGQCLWCNL